MYGRITSLAAIGSVSLTLASCNYLAAQTTPSPAEYKISEDGGAYVSDVTTFDSLGYKSAVRGQKYKIVSLSGGDTPAHFLVINITQYYGNKKGDESDGQMLFVRDGSASFDCRKYISQIKLSVSDDDIPNITCKFEVMGTMPLARRAVLKNV